MPKKSNHDSKEKYPYIRVGTLEPQRIKDIFTAKNRFFNVRQCFRIRIRHIITKDLAKRQLTIMSCSYITALFKQDIL